MGANELDRIVLSMVEKMLHGGWLVKAGGQQGAELDPPLGSNRRFENRPDFSLSTAAMRCGTNP